MTLAELKRLNDSMLADIVRRLGAPLNDDGLRAWYRHDGGVLLEEVIALRRERAAAIEILGKHPPLEGLDQSASLVEVAERLAELWAEYQQGVWQRAEVKRIRDKLAAAEKQVAQSAEKIEDQARRILGQGEQIDQLQAQLVDAVADGQRAAAEAQRACAERSAKVAALLNQAKESLE